MFSIELIEKYADQRAHMVEKQLKSRGIDDARLLELFSLVPRELFVADSQRPYAYDDIPLPILNGQTISQPYVVALMLQYLKLRPHMEVLEIGGGSGYATALLAHLVKQVDSVEVYRDLLDSAARVLEGLGLTNVSLEHRSAWEQSSSEKVYDRVILWASPPRIPSFLFESLREGGILVAPEGKQEQHIWVYQKAGGDMLKQKKESVRFVPLVQGTTNEIDMFN